MKLSRIVLALGLAFGTTAAFAAAVPQDTPATPANAATLAAPAKLSTKHHRHHLRKAAAKTAAAAPATK
jgi:hypothetical protein